MRDAEFWTAFGAVATGVAALVTAATVIFIARQTSATRRAAQAGEDTARVAVDALALTQKEHSRAQFLAIEAVKTRIDASMPRITVTAGPQIHWPPLLPSNFGEAQPANSAEPFRLPRDSDDHLIVRVDIAIVNDGPKTVSLTFNQELRTSRGAMKAALLAVGESLDGTFEVSRSVKDWSDIWTEREATRAGGPSQHFQVMYTDPADTGAVEFHDVIVQGTILRPLVNETGAWVLIDYPNVPWGDIGNIVASVQPTTRRYWLSRLKNIPLPEISLDL